MNTLNGNYILPGEKQLAVLIDADNAQASVIEQILQEIAKFGEASVRRIYGDFTCNQSSSWKAPLNEQSIKPIQQFAYTTGKNATDCAMIIDAMDLLHTRKLDGFCLVTSDSDFTGLAMRIREQGLRVYGIGRKQTPASFRNACHKFIFTENLILEDKQIANRAVESPTSDTKTGCNEDSASKLPMDVIITALEQTSDDQGWSQLGTFGSNLGKIKTDFDSRSYGYKKLSDLVKGESNIFEVDLRPKGLYVRYKG